MKVSIVTPFYNTNPLYLEKCINSILGQTFKDFKIIIVNDGSTQYDYSKVIPDSDKILYLSNPTNLGVSKAVNLAYSHADSEYIVRFDSDDYFHSTLLQREVEFLDSNPDYVGICTDLKRVGIALGILKRRDNWSILGASKGEDYGFAPSMMFRSHVLKYITTDESLPICEDFKFHVDLLRFGKIKILHEPLYYYRRHPGQITKNIPKEERKQCFNYVVKYAASLLENKD